MIVYEQENGELSLNLRTAEVGGEPKAQPVPPPAMGRAAPHQLRLPRAPSHLASSACRDGAPQLSAFLFHLLSTSIIQTIKETVTRDMQHRPEV